jgi:uncharacterized protein (TIGR03435 family)
MEACLAMDWKRRLVRSVFAGVLAAGASRTVALSQTVTTQAASAAKTEIADTWQGTLHVGRDLRAVIKIEKAPDGTLKSTLWSIDQGGNSLAAKSTSFAAGTLKINIESIDGSYEGKMGADGNTITGTFTQGDRPTPLILLRATPETAWAIPAPPPKIPPMDPNANPSFEVATIKPTDPGVQGKGLRINGRHLSTLNTSLAEIIAFAYGVQQKQVVGTEPWMESDHFDLSAQPDLEGQPSDTQWKNMIRKLLADRFGLKFHPDKREMAAYIMTMAPGGNKMTANTSGGALPDLTFTKRGSLTVRNATMTDFSNLMQTSVFDRPVVNRTALEGRWDFVLKWTPDETQFPDAPPAIKVPPPADAGDAPPNVYKAMQEQLGLKLEPAKTQVDVMVLDHVQKPSDN